ncbi:putative decaprenylphosphoryl-beta-D-ribose oxidase [Gimesia panareensis]|uniref:Putative decaprenylphosphoryl-beta-D-ribose oxidase n=1 Tax=Gimesia panareensis TaxID=2527978 RepID=A0A518FHE9_9PLAN|nr:FAD-binding oxidoreductase [Gimesia panareensis]QDV15774.1 putative decaprenylphosphoryl-beta-D-ribose oxidase [Gimesia panareensis]
MQKRHIHRRRFPLKLRRKTVKAFSFLALCLITLAISRPLIHLTITAWQDREKLPAPPTGFLNDASRMNLTHVKEVWSVPADANTAELQLSQLLQRAHREGLPVSIAGARHSMGGHTLNPDGLVIDMTTFNQMTLDAERNLLHVQSGARWSEIIPWLDQQGKSVKVMQSNNSFTVGGSISVNCHGWQYGCPPIASTVESFRLMRADGSIVTCSRTENPELFSLVLGGYGLFGVILDVDLQVVPNESYRLQQAVVPVEQAPETFDALIDHPDATLAFARMNVTPDQFLQEVIINVLYRESDTNQRIPALSEPEQASLRRYIFRGSGGSAYGKKLRWQAETKLQPHLQKQCVSRNQLFNEGAEVFENRSADHTDILHEYFVPRAGLAEFVAALQEIIPRHEGDLLNVTIRQVEADQDTFLRYADQPMFAFVMLFYQPRTAAGDQQMEALTVELIDSALQVNGCYYLPYRLHATPRQFHKAYPQAEEFFALKRKYDPRELFQNQFYRKYGMSKGLNQDENR